MAKTSIQIKTNSDIWPRVEKWADENHYILEKTGPTARLYLRKDETAHTQISVFVSQTDQNVEIRAWYSDMIRKTVALDSVNPYAALPRKEALAEVQQLAAACENGPTGQTKKAQKENPAFNLGRSLRKFTGKK